MPGYKPPGNFDFSKPVEWPAWKQRFLRYRTASKITEDDGAIRVSGLIYSMGQEAEKIFYLFAFPAATAEIANPQNHFETVIRLFDNHFVPKRNVIHERAKFYTQSQLPNESIEQYVCALNDLAEHADFHNKDESIRDRLVLGISDRKLSQKLQLERNLTLQSAVDEARHYELVKGQVEGQRSKEQSVDAVGKKNGGGGMGDSISSGELNLNIVERLQVQINVGNVAIHTTEVGNVLLRGKPANIVIKWAISNLYVVKRTLRKRLTNLKLRGYQMYTLRVQWNKTAAAHGAKTIRIGSQDISFKLDTGADVSVISRDTYKSLTPKPTLYNTNAVLQSPDGKLVCLRTFKTNVKTSKCVTESLEIFVIECKTDNLLSREAATHFDFVKCLDEVDKTVFSSDLDKIKCKPVKILLKNNAQPYVQHTARRIPIPLLPKVEAELQRMEKPEVIQHITEPANWCAPIVPVAKLNGAVRLCTDFNCLNATVKRECYILLTLEDITHNLRGSTFFSKLDATSGYWQIPLDEESTTLTTFITPFGRFFYKRLPFGISSASEIFQRVMEELLGDIPGVECF